VSIINLLRHASWDRVKIWLQVSLFIFPLIAIIWGVSLKSQIDLNAPTNGKIESINYGCRSVAGSDPNLINCAFNQKISRMGVEIYYKFLDQNGIEKMAKKRAILPFETLNDNVVKYFFQKNGDGNAILITPFEFFLMSRFAWVIMGVISGATALLFLEAKMREN